MTLKCGPFMLTRISSPSLSSPSVFQDVVLFCALKHLSREAELRGDTETNLGEQSKVWKDIAVGSDDFF